MSANFIDLYRDKMQANGNLGTEAAPNATFRTGIDVLDFRLGYIDLLTNLPRIGIPSGKMLYLVAKSGVGKSTLAQQICRNLWHQFPGNSFANYFDCEQSVTHQRIASLEPFAMNINQVYQNFILTNRDVYSETIEEATRTMHAIKMDHYAQGVKIPVLDSYGNHIHNPITGEPEYTPPPTIYVVDSLYRLSPKKYEQTSYEDSTNMDNARVASANATIFKSILPLLEEANITLIVINHVRKRINTSPFPTPAQLNYLKQDEYLPGGDTPIYLTRSMGKMIAGKKLQVDKDYGIDGYLVTWLTLKSMNSQSGLECQLVYDPVRGFDNELSNLHFLKTMNLLEGTRSFQIPGSTKKFTLKNFKQTFWEDREFGQAFISWTWRNLVSIIPHPSQGRVIDMYSANISRHDDVDIVMDKTRAAYSAQLKENERLLYDQSSQNYYARDDTSGSTRWLEAVAI